MSYRLTADESPEDAVRRIAREQIDKAVDEIVDHDLDRERSVHQVRKRCKKIRALLRLFRPALGGTYRAENARFRDLGRELSELRDQTSRIESFDRLRADIEPDLRRRIEPVRALLVSERDGVYRRFADPALLRVREELDGAKGDVECWKLSESGFDAIAGGIEKTYRRARRTRRDAQSDGAPEVFHEWRKRVKYHRYHVRLLSPLWESLFDSRRRALHELSDLLGEAHDFVVLKRWLLDRGTDVGSAAAVQRTIVLADSERMRRRCRALARGRPLFVDEPDTFRDRIALLWTAFRDQ